MAQRVVTLITDDITGEESAEAATHTLSLDGIAYEIDLAPDSYGQLLKVMEPYMENGRRAGKVKAATAGSKKGAARAASGPDTAKVREWAKAQGFEVNDRGRVPANIREAYDKAH